MVKIVYTGPYGSVVAYGHGGKFTAGVPKDVPKEIADVLLAQGNFERYRYKARKKKEKKEEDET